MLPPDKAIEDYHPAQEAFHGHTQLLLPFYRLATAGGRRSKRRYARLAGHNRAGRIGATVLTPQEVAILHEEIREPVLHAHITTYSEGITDSRHILHPKSASAVARMSRTSSRRWAPRPVPALLPAPGA